MSNTETVQQIYDAFFRRDVDSLLKHMSDDVDWEYGATASSVPWLQTRRGRSGVADFLQSLSGLDIQRLEPKHIVETDNIVIVLVDFEGTVKETGAPLHEEDEVHIWHFDEQGQVARFRHRVDTLQHERAVTGVSDLVG